MTLTRGMSCRLGDVVGLGPHGFGEVMRPGGGSCHLWPPGGVD
jgi:hypothetical protein